MDDSLSYHISKRVHLNKNVNNNKIIKNNVKLIKILGLNKF